MGKSTYYPYFTHSLSRRSRVLPKAQRYVLIITMQLMITELMSQRKAAKLVAKIDIARSIE